MQKPNENKMNENQRCKLVAHRNYAMASYDVMALNLHRKRNNLRFFLYYSVNSSPLDKMAAISRTIFPDAFSLMDEMYFD